MDDLRFRQRGQKEHHHRIRHLLHRRGATGVITISTSGSVTLVGTGVGVSDQYTNLRIDCTGQATDLTLQDVYISNSDEAGNMINFKAPGNSLTFSGVSILDQDGNASGYAMVHVPSGSSLYVSGSTAYFYKRDQGAGIGGNPGQSSYAAAKEGIRGMSRVAASEWGPDNINVNIVCPIVMTKALEEWRERAAEMSRRT